MVALPTETVYGLGGLATLPEAVEKIFRIKNRPSVNPLIVHVASAGEAQIWAGIPDETLARASAFWPGPLTLVCPLRAGPALAPAVTAGLSTVAVRVPAHPLMQAVLKALHAPLAAPSANPSGTLSCTSAHDVAEAFAGCPEEFRILDGGPCAEGVESTIVDTTTTPWSVLRWGALSLETLQATWGGRFVVPDPGLENPAEHPPALVRSPGQLLRHYAPRLPLRMNATGPRPGEAFLGFGPSSGPCTLNLSPSGTLEEAARNLFAMLHQLDQNPEHNGIAVAPVPCTGPGHAINDRLKRACTATAGSS